MKHMLLAKPETDAVRQAWGVPADYSSEPVDSFHGGVFKLDSANGRAYYLKRRPGPDYVMRELALLSWLNEHGIVTAPPMLTHTGQPYLRRGDDVFALYPALSGQVPTDHYAPGAEERARTYGMGIAHLHERLAEYPQTPDFRLFDVRAEITQWIEHDAQKDCARLKTGHVFDAARHLCRFLEQHQSGLPAHLIHRDIHPGNMLQADGEVCGYLDFDLACIGARLFDPCYCLTSMLVGGFGHEENRVRWLPLLTRLLSGYHSVLPLQANERQAVFSVLIAIQALFLAFSCRTDLFGAAQYNAHVIAWLLENRQAVEIAVELTCNAD